MRDMTEYSPIIQKLLDRTREGKVAWEEATRGFKAQVGLYTFRVFSSDEGGDTTVRLTMRDDRDSEIFEVTLTDDPPTIAQYRQIVANLKEIYELARRKALNVEEKLGEVSGLLDQM